jgi:hypothetical protein
MGDDNIKTHFEKVGREDVDGINLAWICKLSGVVR